MPQPKSETEDRGVTPSRTKVKKQNSFQTFSTIGIKLLTKYRKSHTNGTSQSEETETSAKKRKKNSVLRRPSWRKLTTNIRQIANQITNVRFFYLTYLLSVHLFLCTLQFLEQVFFFGYLSLTLNKKIWYFSIYRASKIACHLLMATCGLLMQLLLLWVWEITEIPVSWMPYCSVLVIQIFWRSILCLICIK